MEECIYCGVEEGSRHQPNCPAITINAKQAPLGLRKEAPKAHLAPNDGSNAGTSHYDLPKGATELKHLIWYKGMNAQVGEIFRSAYRLGTASHSSKIRDLNKIIAYAEQEKERLWMYEDGQ